LLHEMDLLNLFDDLRQAGYFAVHDCALKRIAGGAAGTGANAGADAGGGAASATLSADCSLLWLTLGSGQPVQVHP
jgi:hypothetical protein